MHGLNSDEDLVNLSEYPVQTLMPNMSDPYTNIREPKPVITVPFQIKQGPTQGPI